MYARYFRDFQRAHPDAGRKLWSLAARWGLGVESDETVGSMVLHNYVIDKEPDYQRTVYQKPMLTLEERDQLYRMVGRL